MKRNPKPSISNDDSRQKRTKVVDLDRDRPLTCRIDVSPISLNERHVTYPYNAKTSEFAFFKKFKEDANHKFSSSLPRQKELQSKKLNLSDRFRERASPVENRCGDFTSHHLVEDVTPVKSLHLPLGNSSKISDIFSRKRQKLRQFIHNMSFNGNGESCEKGYGVIFTLLSRLIPVNSQYKFNNNLEKLQRLPGRCSPRLDYNHHLNNSSSPCRLNKSRGRVFSHSDFSTDSADNNFQVQYGTKDFDCDLDRKMTLLDVNGSHPTAAVENYRSLISGLFKPHYDLYDQGEHLHLRKQELEPLLLGWETDDTNDESSSQLTKFNAFAESPILFADDHQPTLHKSFGAVELCSFPFPSSNCRNLYSLPYSSLASYQIHGLSRHKVENEEDIDATFNNVHLNFSSVPKCLSQCINYADDLSSRDDWLMNNVLDNECQHPSVESLCASSSGFVFDFGWKYLSGSKEQCQTAYHILKYPLDEMKPIAFVSKECSNDSPDDVLVNYQPPFFLQAESFFQEGRVCSVLTDELSWDAARNEINVDITEMDYV